MDKVLQAARDVKDPTVNIRTDLPSQLNELRNALLKIRGEYRDRPVNPLKCKLAYKKSRPVLYKPVQGGPDVEVKVVKNGENGDYVELIED